MLSFADLLVKTFCYVGYFTGLCLFIAPIIAPLIRNRIAMRKFRTGYINAKNSKSNKLISHLLMLISTITGKRSYSSVFVLFIVSVALFALTLVYLSLSGNFSILTVVLAIVSGCLPYFYLQLRLRSTRIAGSYEAEGLVTELINQYKINYFNMIEAIDKTIPFLNGYPYSKKSMFRLSLKIKDYASDAELDEAISEFIYAIDTEWATMLGINIYMAITDGANVTESLDDILQELKTLKSVVEKDKRKNNESFFMIRYFSIFILIFTVVCELFAFKIDINKILGFQFHTPIGVKLSVIILVLIIFNYGLLYLFKKPKYDF